jgi:hypothetical protein
LRQNRSRSSLGNPFQLWNDLAWKTGAMMLASAQVIGHRTGRIAAAGPQPSARDRREFARMSHEKIEATVESAQAMAMQLSAMNTRCGMQAFANLAAGATALASLAASRSVGQAFTRHATLLRALGQPAMSASQLSNGMAALVRSGLEPIHARAAANARRLRGG